MIVNLDTFELLFNKPACVRWLMEVSTHLGSYKWYYIQGQTGAPKASTLFYLRTWWCDFIDKLLKIILSLKSKKIIVKSPITRALILTLIVFIISFIFRYSLSFTILI